MTRGATPGRSEKPQTETGAGATGVSEEQPTKRSSLLLSILPESVLFGAAIYLFILASDFQNPAPNQLGPGFWPQMLSASIAVCLAIRIGQKVLTRKRPTSQLGSDKGDSDLRWSRVILAVALVVGYIFGAIFLGFTLSTALFLMIFIYLGGQRKWYVVPLGILGSLAFTYIFLGVVYVALPSGVGVFDRFSVIVYQLLGIY